mgnify:CR=1 FL=1
MILNTQGDGKTICTVKVKKLYLALIVKLKLRL